jgi:arachidonate 15-lipoxygenase
MKPLLPQDDANPLARRDRLARRRETYRFVYDWPPDVATAAELPKSDDYGPLYLLESAKTYAEVGVNVAAMVLEGHEVGDLLHQLERRFVGIAAEDLHRAVFTTPKQVAQSAPDRRVSSWREFERFFATWPAPEVVRFFDDPEQTNLAFAWQRVAGVNPMVLTRCDRIPDHLRVDEKRFEKVIGAGDSLAAAIAEQRLYLADYAMLEGVEAGTTDGLTKYLCAPMALFVAEHKTRRLRPIAIQLGQTPDAAVFDPTDGWRWRMAMLVVQSADANVHEGVFHLGRTHMVMEAVKVCMERQLDEEHPLYRLLHPHLETTLAINHSAKTSLIAPGGTVDRCFAPTIQSFASVVKKALDTYPIRTASPLEDLQRRGLGNVETLEHPYRDDVTIVWGAVESFVREYVEGYYPSNEAVAADVELQAFARELSASDGGRLVDVPVPATVEDAVALIARLVFIAGPGHSCVNFPQFPFMGFAPNITGASFSPLPGANAPDDEAALTAMLPPLRVALEGVTMVYFLSAMRPTKLGHYPPFHFRDHVARAAVDRFQQRLAEVESIIDEREPSRLISYPYLKPSLILQSISV